MKTKVNPLNNNGRSSLSLNTPFTLDAQQTMNLFEHSSIYRQTAEHSRTFANPIRRGRVFTPTALLVRERLQTVFANNGVNAPLEMFNIFQPHRGSQPSEDNICKHR